MAEQDEFPTTHSPMKRLRKLGGFRRSNTKSKMKYSQSSPSLSALATPAPDAHSDVVSVCSAGPLVFGCLKVRTHADSLRRSFSSVEIRNVEFSTIEVRSYPMIMGDNPSVSSGPPITIDWEHQDVEECDLSGYEESKPEKRSKSQMLLPAEVREAWMRDQGYARSEMAKVGKEIDRIKRGRSAAISQQKWQPLFSLGKIK